MVDTQGLPQHSRSSAEALNRWACRLATGFGCGYSPYAPGTVGSLVGVLLYLPLNGLFAFWINVLIVSGLFVVGVYFSGLAERALQERDSRVIVIDEIHGMFLTLLLIPGQTYILAAFILFRALDILKPFPAGWMERKMKGGWAIMMDDVIAAVYTIFILHEFDLLLDFSFSGG